MPRLAPSGKGIRDDSYGRRCHLSEFYIASSLSLNSLPLGFEKIFCFVQLPDKLFDLRNRWSANLLNKWRDIRVGLGRRRRVWVNSIVASGFHNRRSFPSCGTPITPLRAPAAVLIPKHKSGKARIATGIISQLRHALPNTSLRDRVRTVKWVECSKLKLMTRIDRQRRERHRLFRCGAFRAARIRRPSIPYSRVVSTPPPEYPVA